MVRIYKKIKKMGHQIIKQPDGNFCIYSSIVDNIINANCSKEDIIEIFQSKHGIIGKEHAEDIIKQLEEGKRPYSQFTMSFDEMLKTIKDLRGKEELEKIISLFY